MSDGSWNHKFFELMKTEHQELSTAMVDVRNVMSASQRDRNRLKDAISRLGEIVETHFDHEECGGYMKSALERAPRFTVKAEVLRKEHQTLLEEVEKLRLLVHSGLESDVWWDHISSDYEDFAIHLIEHEHAENELIQAAFTQDIGTGD